MHPSSFRRIRNYYFIIDRDSVAGVSLSRSSKFFYLDLAFVSIERKAFNVAVNPVVLLGFTRLKIDVTRASRGEPRFFAISSYGQRD